MLLGPPNHEHVCSWELERSSRLYLHDQNRHTAKERPQTPSKNIDKQDPRFCESWRLIDRYVLLEYVPLPNAGLWAWQVSRSMALSHFSRVESSLSSRFRTAKWLSRRINKVKMMCLVEMVSSIIHFSNDLAFGKFTRLASLPNKEAECFPKGFCWTRA